MKSKLAPCPFCGKEVEPRKYNDEKFYIKHTKRNFRCIFTQYESAVGVKSIDSLIKIWNKRSVPKWPKP